MYIGLDGKWSLNIYISSLLICCIGLAVLVPRAMLSPFSRKMTRHIQEREFTIFQLKRKSTDLSRLINVLKAANQNVPDSLMKFGTTVKKKQHGAYGAFFKEVDDSTKTATKITFDD